MSTGFDPYHAWLGSLPGSRPSNHYELLGLKLFQSEPPIIAEAADERMARVEAQLQGPYAAAAKQILQELTTARAELLSPATKRVYDAHLRAQLGMPPAAEVRPPSAPTVRPAAATVVMPTQTPPMPPAAAPTAAVPMAAVPINTVPIQAVPIQAVPIQAVPMQGMPAQAVPYAPGAPAAIPVAAMPYGAPMMAQAVPMMAPGVAQAMPVQGYAPGMVAAQPAMPGFGYGESTADGGLEDIETRRRRRRRSYSGPIIAVVALLVVIGGLAGVGFLYRDTLIEALENKPQTVIVQGDRPEPERPASKPAAPAVQPAKAPPPVAKTEMAKPASPDQLASNVPVAPKVTPVAPKKKPPVKPVTKPRATQVGMGVSIKPLSPEEKATVGKTLAGARAALADRNSPKVEEQLNLAMLEASSAESLAAIDRMRMLQEAVHEFWHAVRESTKGLKPVDELEVDGKKMIVIDATDEHLSVRADGKVADYKIEKLPTPMAIFLARQWLRKGDPASNVVMGAFLSVDPKGDRERGRKLLQDAAAGGSEVAKTLLAMDAEDK